MPFGRYTLLSPLAAGGMGEIFLARLDGLQGVEKLCVIKKILPQLASDADFVERFVNEAKILVKLSHGSIAQVLDVGLADGDPYIAMEYVDGKDLRKVAARARDKGVPLPLTLVLFVMGRVLDALAYAHRKKDDDDQELGLVHRDVSPQNVLISYEGEVKVIDFGLAKSTLNVSKTHPSIILGKFLYMSPEQARHQGVDRRSDLYAVGLCLYELMTGANPFDEVPPGELMARVAAPNIKPIREVDPLCPGPVQAMVDRALQVNPDHRFQTAEEFRGKLQSCLVEIDSSAGPESVSRYMRETFSAEHQSERKLLASLREANRVAQRAGPPPRREPQNEVETAVVNLASIASTGPRPANTVQPLSFAPTPRATDGVEPSGAEKTTSPGVLVDAETRPAVAIPQPPRKSSMLPFDEPTTDSGLDLPGTQPVVVTPDPAGTQPQVVLGTLIEPTPNPVPAAAQRKPPVLHPAQPANGVAERATVVAAVPTGLQRRRKKLLWGVGVVATLLGVVGGSYFALHDWFLAQLGRGEASEPARHGKVEEQLPDGTTHELNSQAVARMPVPPQTEDAAEALGLNNGSEPSSPKPGASPGADGPTEDLLSTLNNGGKTPVTPRTVKAPKHPVKMDAFHLQWRNTFLQMSQLKKKHSCEEPSMTLLCRRFEELRGNVDAAGDDASRTPGLKQNLDNVGAAIREKSHEP